MHTLQLRPCQVGTTWPAQCFTTNGAALRHHVRPSNTLNVAHRSMRVAAASLCQEEPQCACAIVIVDHGSRRKASNDMLVEFCQLYQQITQHPIVEPAHMEIAEPSIAQAIARCVEAGAQRIVVAPYFLSRGRHIQDDIPALVAASQEQYPNVKCSIAEPIGIEPLMVKLIQNRVNATLLKDCPAATGFAAATVAEDMTEPAGTCCK